MTIRDELCRFIQLNDQGRIEETYDSLEQLDAQFGVEVIPELVKCLEDGNPDVRRLAVQLLAEARPRSDVAVPEIIRRMEDEDWLVVTTTLTHIGDFGELAAEAIPLVEKWLQSPNEYLRVLAATTILKIDPSRTEFLAMIQDAAHGEHPVAQSLAQAFLAEDG